MSSLKTLAREVQGCTACALYKRATQAVFGEGLASARLVLVGEQPGDQEDLEGRPFVGPAGKVLDAALEESGVDRRDLYMTNAVKHFKWEERGKRRLHKTPNRGEIVACRPWIEAELAAVRPQVVVALGATAGNSLIGPSFRVGTHRGTPLHAEVGKWSGLVVASIHPSAVLRAPTPDGRAELRRGLAEDLRRAGELAAG